MKKTQEPMRQPWSDVIPYEGCENDWWLFMLLGLTTGLSFKVYLYLYLYHFDIQGLNQTTSILDRLLNNDKTDDLTFLLFLLTQMMLLITLCLLVASISYLVITLKQCLLKEKKTIQIKKLLGATNRQVYLEEVLPLQLFWNGTLLTGMILSNLIYTLIDHQSSSQYLIKPLLIILNYDSLYLFLLFMMQIILFFFSMRTIKNLTI